MNAATKEQQLQQQQQQQQQQQPLQQRRAAAKTAAEPSAMKTPKVIDSLSFLELSRDLTEKEEQLRLHVRNICETRVAPIAAEMWERGEFDRRLIDACKAIGPAGLQIKGYGCAGLTNTEACLTAIEMSRVDASFFTFAVVHSALSMKTIDAAGSPAQKQYWLPLMARWEKIGCFALTEAAFGSDAAHIQTKAKKIKGGFTLNGSKRWIGNATYCDVAVIWARDEDTNLIEAFLV
ncbi:acyl-CoA dehydrogenase, putative, partial [Eimeria acervulina]